MVVALEDREGRKWRRSQTTLVFLTRVGGHYSPRYGLQEEHNSEIKYGFISLQETEVEESNRPVRQI
jgi:hypothetical protein